jgi:uncharacterized protein
MAIKRNTEKKKGPKKKTGKKTKSLKKQIIKASFGFLVLIVIVAAAGLAVRHLIPQRPIKIPTYEIYPREKAIPPTKPLPKPIPVPEPIPAPRPEPVPIGELPKISIIIDDIGYDRELGEKFIELDTSLTFSILPRSPFQTELSRLAFNRGDEIMLHLPMEPKEYPKVNPGPGALLTHMSPHELIGQLELDLADMPNIKGVNNHMGSKMTASSTQMNEVLSVLKKRGLYFIDSKTDPDSIGLSAARVLNIPFGERDVFLDHVQTKEFVRNQIELLIRIAEKHGSAIGIAHPHEVTYRILKEKLPELNKRVKIVPASQLVHRPS